MSDYEKPCVAGRLLTVGETIFYEDPCRAVASVGGTCDKCFRLVRRGQEVDLIRAYSRKLGCQPVFRCESRDKILCAWCRSPRESDKSDEDVVELTKERDKLKADVARLKKGGRTLRDLNDIYYNRLKTLSELNDDYFKKLKRFDV